MTVHHFTEQSSEVLKVLNILTRRLIRLHHLDMVKTTFKSFSKLRRNMRRPVYAEIIEDNAINKALFFLSKMKYAQAREAMKDFQFAESTKMIESIINH